MTFSPPPPPGFYRDEGKAAPHNTFQAPTTNLPQGFERRPQVWVPPLTAFGAFAAGYAIPWEFGSDPSAVISRIVFPLILAASFCLVAGYFTYRTVPGWRLWTWVAFGSLLLNAIHSALFAYLAMPLMVNVILWLSVIALGVAGAFGAERQSEIHRRPSITPPGGK